jgi:hypothetical protein
MIFPAYPTSTGELGVKAVLPEGSGQQMTRYEDRRSYDIKNDWTIHAEDSRGVERVLRAAEDRFVARMLDVLSEDQVGHAVVGNIVRRTVS